MTTLEKNILIANWLEWYSEIISTKWWFSKDGTVQAKGDEDLAFHKDSNLQWLCLEKIAEEYTNLYQCKDKLSPIDAIRKLEFFYSNEIVTKEDLFESIVNYINSKNENK